MDRIEKEKKGGQVTLKYSQFLKINIKVSELLMNIIVTAGAGFIGSALVRYLINHTEHAVINVDKLTYAGAIQTDVV